MEPIVDGLKGHSPMCIGTGKKCLHMHAQAQFPLRDISIGP